MDIGQKMSMILDTRRSSFGSQQCLSFHIFTRVTEVYENLFQISLRLGSPQCDNFHRSEFFEATIFIPLMGTS